MFLHTWSAIASTLAQEELEHKCSTINKYRKKKKNFRCQETRGYEQQSKTVSSSYSTDTEEPISVTRNKYVIAKEGMKRSREGIYQ